MTQGDEVLEWARREIDGAERVSDHSRTHGGHESSTRRIKTSECYAYLKTHSSRSHWEAEVHGYEQWAHVFGENAPRLLAVKSSEPYALIITELRGSILEDMELEPDRERSVWRAAGAALPPLHDLPSGSHFGGTDRFGVCAGDAASDPIVCLTNRYTEQIEQASRAGYLSDDELKTVHAARELIPSFSGERPTACHRDYCAANWLVDDQGAWAGVIDFEFSRWDLRVADFTRDAHWSWIRRPELVEAFFEGYGRRPTGEEEKQMLVAHTEYALGAIVWGHENAFYGFEQEGRDALLHLSRDL